MTLTSLQITVGLRARWLAFATILLAVSGSSTAFARQGGVPAPAPPPAAPAASTNAWDWSAFGSLQYDNTYTATLRLANGCKVPATFLVTPEVPGMSSGGDVSVLPGETMDVELTLKTPPRPPKPTDIDRSDPANPVHVYRTLLRGRVRIAYEGYEDASYVCYGMTGVTDVIARVEWAMYEPQRAKIGAADDCTVWWNTGQRPPHNPALSEAQCVDTIRKLAADYRDRVLDPVAKQVPDRWTWLPSAAQIQSMNIAELLAMKERAAEQLANKRQK